MRTRCGPFTALAATLAVVTSTSSVRAVIHRHAPTVMPEPDTRFGASAAAGRDATSGTAVAAMATTTNADRMALRMVGSPERGGPRSGRYPSPTLPEKNIFVYDLLGRR